MTTGTPETIQRVQVRAPFQFRRELVPVPHPLDRECLIRVDVCGLCRSDLHAAASWAEGWQEIGHEFGGTVVAAGREDGPFHVGDRVAVRNASACGKCEPCRAGQARSCRHLVVNMQGFNDFALCDERSLVNAGDLDDDALALVEPTNVVLDLLYTAQVNADHRVIVLGSGTLGLLTAYFARHEWNIPRVLMVGRATTSPLADHLGMAYMPLNEAADRSALRAAIGDPADRVLVTTPPSTLEQALSLCRPGGSVLTVGLDETERCTVGLDISRLIFGQHTIRGVCAAPNAHFEQAVSLLHEHGHTLGSLIARRASREHLEEVLREWRSRPHYDGKTILLNRAKCRNGRETSVV